MDYYDGSSDHPIGGEAHIGQLTSNTLPTPIKSSFSDAATIPKAYDTGKLGGEALVSHLPPDFVPNDNKGTSDTLPPDFNPYGIWR